MREKVKKVHTLGKRAVNSKSFRRYLFVGVSTVMLDFLLLLILRSKFSSGLLSAVSIAYWISIAYNFTLNRYWSFEASKGLVPRQLFLYGLLLIFNYLVTLAVVWGIESVGISEYLAKLMALGLTITWTYIFYKKIIFIVK